MTDAVQLGLFGRTSQEPSAAGSPREPISPLFSTPWPNSGRWNSNGEYWTHSSSESPSADAVSLSSLASILEPKVASKYFLSARACAGILRRAEKRGRELPPALKQALEAVASQESPEPLGGGSGQRGWPQDVERMTFIPETQTVVSLTATGVGTCGVDDNQAQAGHLVPMTDDTERERERDDSRPSDGDRDAVTGRASRRGQRPGRVHGPDHPDLPEVTGTVTTTWAKGPGNTQVDEGLVIPVLDTNEQT